MAVVVTGAAGFIGRAAVRALEDAGVPVVAIDRRPSGSPVPALRADLLDGDELVADALRTADAVIHLAGCPGVRDPSPDVEQRRHRDNVLATSVVLDLTPARVPVVVASSSSVYGGSMSGAPCVESDSLRPRGGYARSKACAEALCHRRLDAGGLVAVARPFTVAGEGQRPDMALARWIADAREGRPLRILGSPDRTRDITDVRDAARVLVALVERGARGPVNVGTGVGHRLRDLVAAVSDVLDTDLRTVVEPAHPDEVADTLADTGRLRRLVGFVPDTDLRALVARQAAAGDLEPAGR